MRGRQLKAVLDCDQMPLDEVCDVAKTQQAQTELISKLNMQAQTLLILKLNTKIDTESAATKDALNQHQSAVHQFTARVQAIEIGGGAAALATPPTKLWTAAMPELPTPIKSRHPTVEKPECQWLNSSVRRPSCSTSSSVVATPQAAATWLSRRPGSRPTSR